MNEELKKALDDVFAEYPAADALENLKLEMASALEDKFREAQKRGVIEEAAKKKVLAELGKALQEAERAAAGNKQKRLEQIARALGLSHLGSTHAMLRLVCGLLALCGLGAAIAYWVTRREIAGSIAAMLPFAALAAGGFVFLRLTAYKAERAPMSVAKAAPASMAAAALCAALLAAFAAAIK